MTVHIPVMLEEVLEHLKVTKNGSYVDGTVGGGGHLSHIVSLSAPDGIVLGVDKDADAVAALEATYSDDERVHIVHGSYENIPLYVKDVCQLEKVNGILLDLGYSSDQIETRARGFSFLKEEPLDMRYDIRTGNTAAQIVNTYDEKHLISLLKRYGQEQFAYSIVKAIIRERAEKPIHTTTDLSLIIENAVPARYRQKKRHPATKTFQALRIEVNKEFEVIERGVRGAIDVLESGGRLVVLTFHSLEDRLVKELLISMSIDCICPPDLPLCRCDTQPLVRFVKKKALKPSVKEVEINRRSRSAQLRVVEKL